MTIQDFEKNFAAQFDNTPEEEIKAHTAFRNLPEWDSLIALSVMAMIDEIYNVKISGDEMRKAQTINELFDIIVAKK